MRRSFSHVNFSYFATTKLLIVFHIHTHTPTQPHTHPPPQEFLKPFPWVPRCANIWLRARKSDNGTLTCTRHQAYTVRDQFRLNIFSKSIWFNHQCQDNTVNLDSVLWSMVYWMTTDQHPILCVYYRNFFNRTGIKFLFIYKLFRDQNNMLNLLYFI